MSGPGGRRRRLGPRGGESLSWRKQKSLHIHKALTSDPVDIDVLRGAAQTDGGLLSQEIRRKVWPKLLSLNVFHLPPKPGRWVRCNHRDYNQVQMDVRRSLKRFPAGMSDAERSVLLEQLTDMILYVLQSHPDLHYYQGFHDIAVTLLLTVGLRLGTGMLSTLSTHHLRDFMDPTMDRTKHILNYLMPLIQSENSELHKFLLRSEVGCIFALSWLITWYSHVLTDYQHVLRLYDFFLATHPLMPVYCAAQMVLMREQEVLACDCDMASVHQLLSKIPTNFSYESLVSHSLRLFQRHPPSQLMKQASQHKHKSFSVASFHSLQISSSTQRPDFILQRQLQSEPPRSLPPRAQNPLVKLAVWGLSASIGAAAFAVAQSALELGPEFLMGLF
ncbi:TBC1 domain family, member 20, gene 2 L homeolog [Xenopus laevis]|uniref:TBC1 domain family member 20 n=1 Tax=Xenopus laevis TaxID=8355 RepID=Q6DD12_XENLA|nr:TBC1 domain family, member 20, gene 2 L homeolog [Xenopus laevis]AAH77818.1 MGC80462 protein [Xenopus laevis]